MDDSELERYSAESGVVWEDTPNQMWLSLSRKQIQILLAQLRVFRAILLKIATRGTGRRVPGEIRESVEFLTGASQGVRQIIDDVEQWIQDNYTGDHDKYRQQFLEAARQHYGDDELNFDNDAIVSEGGDPGAFVMGWRWIYNSEAGIEDEEEDDAG